MRRPWSLAFILILTFLSRGTQEKRDQYRGLASSWTVIPSRSLAGLHYIFKGFEYAEEESLVKVSGPVIEITNGEKAGSKLYPQGYFAEIDPEDFEEEQKLAQSVFEAMAGNGALVGTAFLVGNNLVLTNRHIMGISPMSKKWECGLFSIQLNHKDERVDCKKVRFCSSKNDYCVVELMKMNNGMAVGEEVKPLRLTRKVKNNPDASLMHIGNAGGLGIMASRGMGIMMKGDEFFHYAPTLGGSSGAPLFDEKNNVIGLNWGHTGAGTMDDSSFGRGILASAIYKELKQTHQFTLKEIKSFKAWHRLESQHRKVKIEPR